MATATHSAGAAQRILLKLSGEALMGNEDYGIDPVMLKRIASEIRDVTRLGVQVAVVIGGGNIFRGAGLARAGMDRVTARSHGHARHRHERARDAGCPREPRRATRA